ncbi:MAG: aconitate hydratase AcnA [Gammaproteobacteria bacterium]|nr:aconitate hydratase AcnA [Gammaproteobacteria bacterium]
MGNSLNTKSTLKVGEETYQIYRLTDLEGANRLPFSLKILLENLLRHEDGRTVTSDDIQALLNWDPSAEASQEIAFRPARVLMQDFTGVPAVVDLAAMRDAMGVLGGNPERINPLQPAELVIDHSVQVDRFASDQAFDLNAKLEFDRNRERYQFLKWGQNAFSNFKVVPPDTGIVHQVNLEYLARVVFAQERDGMLEAYPDTLVGTDSHTTMINGIGVLGWGVGGIEAEASMLGQPISMLIPRVVGFRLAGSLPEGATGTDLVLTIVQMLREHGVVGKFVEFHGDGLDQLSIGDRATIANMAPEYGATCGLFPIDAETVNYLRLTGRDEHLADRVEAYAKEQGMWREAGDKPVEYSESLELDLGSVEPSLAGPKRPQDRVPLREAASQFQARLEEINQARNKSRQSSLDVEIDGQACTVGDGLVAIAAITSCTNTSNPSVMVAAGLVAKKAMELGLKARPWVKTSLAPGSRVVTDYLERAGLMEALKQLGFHLVGYGCTTCIGNSGPLPEQVSKIIQDHDLTAVSVLSGNRNFEGRIHAQVLMNYLASPPLVVAYAIAGRMDVDLHQEPIATTPEGQPVYLKDLWPTQHEIAEVMGGALDAGQFRASYQNVFQGDDHWAGLESVSSGLYEWPDSTYVSHPPYFEDLSMEVANPVDIQGARVLAFLGDSVTTDHISPAGSIAEDSPAGRYLIARGVQPADFNSYGSRRGNHEVMMRGTFANIRLRNRLANGVEGGVTRHLPDGELMSIFDAAMKYREEGIPLIVLAGKEYGCGSSRDWAAKGPRLQGVRAVIAESYERIHRSNLIGMGILPLQFQPGESAESLGLTGEEVFDILGLDAASKPGGRLKVTATAADNGGATRTFEVAVRIDTPQESEYYRHGGILHYVLRQLAA